MSPAQSIREIGSSSRRSIAYDMTMTSAPSATSASGVPRFFVDSAITRTSRPGVNAAASLTQLSTTEVGATTRNGARSEEHTSELQSRFELVCCLLLDKKKFSLQDF